MKVRRFLFYAAGVIFGFFVPILPLMISSIGVNGIILRATPILLVVVIVIGGWGVVRGRDSRWRWIGYGTATGLGLLMLAVVLVASAVEVPLHSVRSLYAPVTLQATSAPCRQQSCLYVLYIDLSFAHFTEQIVHPNITRVLW